MGTNLYRSNCVIVLVLVSDDDLTARCRRFSREYY